jgi:hypothetical protein
MARVLPLGAGTCHFGRLRLSPGVHGRRPWPPDGLRRLRRLPRRVCPAQDSVEHYFDMVVLTLWVGVATKLRQVRFRATGVLGLARVSALGGRLRSVTVTTFPVRQIPRFPGSPGARRSYPSSVPARSRWAQPVDPHGPRRRARSAGPRGVRHGLGRGGRFGRRPREPFSFFELLAPNRALRRTENPRVDGSIPSLATTPKWVYSGHTVYISFRAHG